MGKGEPINPIRYQPFGACCLLKGHTYSNKPAQLSAAQVCLSICDLLVDTRHQGVKSLCFHDSRKII